METSPKRKTSKIHYRQAVINTGTTAPSLEAALRSALATEMEGVKLRDQVSLRRHALDPDDIDAQATLLTRILDVNPGSARSFIYAILVGYRPDAEQGLLAAGDGPDLDIASLTAPDGHHFIDYLVFAYVKDDHVLILHGPNAPRRALEDYLSWLLIKQAKTLPHTSSIILRTKIVLGVLSKSQQRVTKIRLGGHGSPASGRPTADLAVPKQRFGRRGFRMGRIRNALDELFGATATADLLDGVTEEEEVTLQVTLGFPGARGEEQRGLPVTQIENAIRNLDEGDIALITPDGTVVGEEARSYHRCKVDMINGLPEPESVLKVMHEAFASFINRKIITPDPLPSPPRRD